MNTIIKIWTVSALSLAGLATVHSSQTDLDAIAMPAISTIGVSGAAEQMAVATKALSPIASLQHELLAASTVKNAQAPAVVSQNPEYAELTSQATPQLMLASAPMPELNTATPTKKLKKSAARKHAEGKKRKAKKQRITGLAQSMRSFERKLKRIF